MTTRLTTLDLVKSLVFSDADSDSGTYDDLLDQMVVETSDLIERLCDRVFAATTYTQYYDGTGTETLMLRQGPLVSVTSVNSVEYEDAGDGVGTRSETLTAVYPYEYVTDGLRSEGWVNVGRLRMLSGVWTTGRRNYKVVYNGGFVDDTDASTANGIPQALVRAATSYVAAMFNLRGMEGLMSRDVGDGSRTTIPEENIRRALIRSIDHFRARLVGTC